MSFRDTLIKEREDKEHIENKLRCADCKKSRAEQIDKTVTKIINKIYNSFDIENQVVSHYYRTSFLWDTRIERQAFYGGIVFSVCMSKEIDFIETEHWFEDSDEPLIKYNLHVQSDEDCEDLAYELSHRIFQDEISLGSSILRNDNTGEYVLRVHDNLTENEISSGIYRSIRSALHNKNLCEASFLFVVIR